MLSRMDIDPCRVPMGDDQVAGPSGLGAWLGLSGTTNLFARTRHDLPSSKWIDTEWTQKAASAGGRTEKNSQTGIARAALREELG
jgi:hypothetical protein